MIQPVGLALIGLGSKWGRQLAAAIQRVAAVELKSCYARSPETRRRFAEEFGAFDAPSLDAALAAPGVEAAVVAAPGHNHLEIAEASVRHGLHVFMEKPVALNLADARRMIDLCQQAGRVLLVNHEMRRLGSSRAMKRLIDEGRLGKVVTAMASLTLAGTFQPDNWRCHRETNPAGALMQLGIHQIETLMYLLGPVASVYGFLAHVAAPADIDDVGMVQLVFENGVRAAVASSYVSPKGYALYLYGAAGNIECNADMTIWPDALRVDSTTSLKLATPQGRQDVPIEPQDALAQQFEEFARSVRGGAPPETGAAEGLAALAVVEAAMRSHEIGLPVDPRTL